MMSNSATKKNNEVLNENSVASLRLKDNDAKQVREEVYVIAKLLARVAVDEYFNSIIVDKEQSS